MHELSIAQAVLDVALRHADGRRVRSVEVSVGHLRAVVPSSLQFAFDLLIDGTPAQGAELTITEVQVRGRCRACAKTTALSAFPLRCGSCGGSDLEVTAGEELCVEAIEVDEEPHEEQEPREEESIDERIHDGRHV